MITYPAFYRRFVFRRISQLGKFVNRADLIEFPKQSVLHLLDDNFTFNKPITFVPSKTNWALWLMPPYKFIHHVKEPPAPRIYQYDEYFRLPMQGLNQAINNYRKANMRFIKPLKDLQDLPSRQGVINIINYNALFRARIIGMRRSVRRFDYIWKSVLNFISSLPATHKHYIPIPIGVGQYDRGEFLMSFKKYTRASIKHPEDTWYLFMMHLNLKLVEQHLRLGSKWDKQVAYFYNAPWKEQNIESLQTAETCYNAALHYWNEAKLWAEKANMRKFRFLFLTDLQYWEDERERIATGSLDYERTIGRELARLEKVRANFLAMDENTY